MRWRDDQLHVTDCCIPAIVARIPSAGKEETIIRSLGRDEAPHGISKSGRGVPAVVPVDLQLEEVPLTTCPPALGALHTEGWSGGCAHAFNPSCIRVGPVRAKLP
jgi:hypothetical protein